MNKVTSNYQSKKVVELRKILKERNLPTTGSKQILVNRLESNDNDNNPSNEMDDSVKTQKKGPPPNLSS